MKNLLIDRVGLVLENFDEEVKVLTCEHELEMLDFADSPTSFDQQIFEYTILGCDKCEHTEEEIEQVIQNTIGY